MTDELTVFVEFDEPAEVIVEATDNQVILEVIEHTLVVEEVQHEVMLTGDGVPGPRGERGERGERGPAGDGEDWLDLTLVFENALI